MKVLILGAGVAGVAAAWYLRRDGHEVTLLERNAAVALETSFANGGQLSYSYVAPLASPSVIPKIPPWLLRRDSPLQVRARVELGAMALDRVVPRRVQHASAPTSPRNACCASPSTAAR